MGDPKNDKLLHILVPSCNHIPDFWRELKMWERPRYYRFNDALPDKSEIKVRYKPLLDATICGHISRNMVVECKAVLGDWVEMRFDNFASVWALQRSSTGDTLLLQLPALVQRRLRNVPNIRSPAEIQPDSALLAVPPVKKTAFGDIIGPRVAREEDASIEDGSVIGLGDDDDTLD